MADASTLFELRRTWREGLVPAASLCDHPADAPSPVAFAPSVEQALIPISLREWFDWALPNGGEGGIRTLGAVSSTRPFQGRTIGHSVTSPWESVEEILHGL